jgi:cell division protein ZapB
VRLAGIPAGPASAQGLVDFIVSDWLHRDWIPGLGPGLGAMGRNDPMYSAGWLCRTRALSSLVIDSRLMQFYIALMTDESNAMFEHELKRLEKRVDALVQVCDQLQDENRSLKQRQDTLTAERATLLQKNEQVRARVEAMIGRLKAMEQGG